MCFVNRCFWYLLLFLASVGARADEVRAVPYVDDPHEEQFLDFFWPLETPDAMVLFIHGGSMVEDGERRSSAMYEDVCGRFVESGVACATMDYRLAPSYQWPVMAEDVTMAIVKVRHMVEERGGNPDRLFLFGHSSGCHLAAIIGTNPKYLAKVNLATKNLAGIVPMGCTRDWSDLALRGATAETIREQFSVSDEVELYETAENYLDANPAHHVGPHVPPTLVVVARKERFFPSVLEQGARFVRLLLENDIPADLVVVPGIPSSKHRGRGRTE